VTLAASFSKPDYRYSRISPLLIIFALALVGVLVGFVRPRPYPGADLAREVGLVAALGRHLCFFAQGLDTTSGGGVA